MDEKRLKQIMTEVIDDKFASFYVDPEKHYQEHLWLSDLIAWSDKVKTSAIKSIVRCVVVAMLGLMVIGFGFFYKGGG